MSDDQRGGDMSTIGFLAGAAERTASNIRQRELARAARPRRAVPVGGLARLGLAIGGAGSMVAAAFQLGTGWGLAATGLACWFVEWRTGSDQ